MSTGRMRRDISGERGQTLVMVAIVMFVLLGVSAMALDVGETLWSRRVQQNAADAAALAGAREIPGNPDFAQQVASQYATNNGFTNGAGGVTVTTRVFKIFNDDDALEVIINRVVPPGLRAAVGADDINVPARAVAIVTPSIQQCDIWPWGIEEDTILYGANGTIYNSGEDGLPYGKKVVLKVPPQYQVQPGNFLALRPGDSSGANDYRDNIKFGACIDNLDTIETEPGNMGNNTEKAVVSDLDSAIRQTDPCYDETTKMPDSVFWEVSKDMPATPRDPVTNEPFVIDSSTDPPTVFTTTDPFALGSPCGNNSGNTGPPSAANPAPAVVLPSTTRVGIVPILEKGTWDAASGNHGHFTAKIVRFAAFYLIGIESDAANQDFVVGAFLSKYDVKGGTPVYGKPLEGPVGYFLWE